MGEEPKKKRGQLRRSVGAVGRGSAKVIGTTLKVTAKGTEKAAKATAKGTGKVAKVAGKATVASAKGVGKGSWFLARGAGRSAVRGARKAFPREEGESVKEYRIRMAKLGFKVSLWTGSIVATTYGNAQAQKIALAFKTYELSKGVFDIGKAIQEHLEEADPAPETFSSINDGLKKLGFVLVITLATLFVIGFALGVQ